MQIVEDTTARRLPRLVALTVAAAALSGCVAHVDADEWMLEPIAFHSDLGARPGAGVHRASEERIDVAFGFSSLAADGAGGFWAESAGSWLHLDRDSKTLARFNVEPHEPLAHVGHMAMLSPSELVVVRNEPAPVVAVLDTTTMSMRDTPSPAADPADGFGDFLFGDIAVHDGDAFVVRYQPNPPEHLDLEVLRVDLESGERTVLYSMPLPRASATDAGPSVPPVDIDMDAVGRIHLATPSARIVLNADGTELSTEHQKAVDPQVAVTPDGMALWWGGDSGEPTANGVTVGGSAQARDTIARHASCDELYRADALRMGDGEAEHPLPFLCSANDAVWTGSTWIVAIGGEGDGVLVRLTPPATLDE